MTSTGADYELEVDSVDKARWSSIIAEFEDATIYQTWSYGSVRWGPTNLSHVVLKRGGEVVAASQARIVKVPVIGKGIAYVPSGPLWRRAGRNQDEETLRQMIRALNREYVRKRRLFLRVLPNEWSDESNSIASLLSEEGLARHTTERPYKTYLLNLSPPAVELRKNLDRKWRGHLNRSEKNDLCVAEGTDEQMYETFARVYRDMHARKRFAEFVDVDQIGAVQKELSDSLKMRTLIATHEGEAVAGIVCSEIGNTAVYFLGATNEKGRQLRAAYLLQWHLIERLKARGCQWYDLGGIDPVRNPGTHSFKAGLSGKAGREVHGLGQFEGCQDLTSRILIKLGDWLKDTRAKRKMAAEV